MNTLVDNIQLTVWSTSHGLGPYHPAVTDGHEVWYWPNVTCTTEQEACDRAEVSLNAARQAARDLVGLWNITEA